MQLYFKSSLHVISSVLRHWFSFVRGGLQLLILAPNIHCEHVVALSEKKQVSFIMAIGNVDLMHECYPKHSRMGTARMK